MSPLTIAAYCGISFMVLAVLTVVQQVRKMQTFHREAFASLEKGNMDGVFKGMLPIALTGLGATFSALGGIVALVFYFVK